MVEIFFPMVLDVALDAVEEVDAEVANTRHVAVFTDSRDNGLQELTAVILGKVE